MSTMMDWVKDAISKLPEPYYNVIIYNTLTGLRPSEACISISLVQQQDNFKNYYNEEKSILEHFRFPEFFIRRTKKAYMSVVNDLVTAQKAYEKPSYNALKLVLRRRKLDTHMYYSRKIFATYLRNRGIEPEIIYVLQGRSPKSIFARHYYKPEITKGTRINDCILSLHRQLTGHNASPQMI